MSNVVIFTEEESMEVLLKSILPKMLPEIEVHNMPKIIRHNGKGDLIAKLPNRLQNWNVPDVRFLIIHDQDDLDCKEQKGNIQEIVDKTNKADRVKIRIACRELESWYFGDLLAVEEAYSDRAYSRAISRLANKAKYRNPDVIVTPKKTLQKLVPYQQVTGTKEIAKYMDVTRNTSASFNAFVCCIRDLYELE
jgi:hypothetical protein